MQKIWEIFVEDLNSCISSDLRRESLAQLPRITRDFDLKTTNELVIPWIQKFFKERKEGIASDFSQIPNNLPGSLVPAEENCEIPHLLLDYLLEIQVKFCDKFKNEEVSEIPTIVFAITSDPESVLRSKALVALVKMLPYVPMQTIVSDLVPGVTERAKSSKFEARQSALILLVAVLQQLTIKKVTRGPEEDEKDLEECLKNIKGLYAKLCNDPHASVRLAASRTLNVAARFWDCSACSIIMDSYSPPIKQRDQVRFENYDVCEDVPDTCVSEFFVDSADSGLNLVLEVLANRDLNNVRDIVPKEPCVQEVSESFRKVFITDCVVVLASDAEYAIRFSSTAQIQSIWTYFFKYYVDIGKSSIEELQSDPEAQFLQELLATVSRDESWKIRKLLASSLPLYFDIFKRNGAHLMEDDLPILGPLLSITRGFLEDLDVEVRSAAVNSSAIIEKIVPINIFVRELFVPMQQLFVADTSVMVRAVVAKLSCKAQVISHVMSHGVKDPMASGLVSIWKKCLSGNISFNTKARSMVLKSLGRIANNYSFDVIYSETHEGSWANTLKTLFLESKIKPHEAAFKNAGARGQNMPSPRESLAVSEFPMEEIVYPQWRLRADLIEGLGKVLSIVKAQNIVGLVNFIFNFWLIGMCDEVYSVRIASVKMLKTVLDNYTSEKAPPVLKDIFVPSLIDFLKNAHGKLGVQKKALNQKKPKESKKTNKNAKANTKGSAASTPRKKQAASSEETGTPRGHELFPGTQRLDVDTYMRSIGKSRPSYLLRVNFLMACHELSVSPELWASLESEFLALFSDKVSNVRLEICSLCRRLPGSFYDVVRTKLDHCAKRDEDDDVRWYAEDALRILKEKHEKS